MQAHEPCDHHDHEEPLLQGGAPPFHRNSGAFNLARASIHRLSHDIQVRLLMPLTSFCLTHHFAASQDAIANPNYDRTPELLLGTAKSMPFPRASLVHAGSDPARSAPATHILTHN